MTSGYEKSKDYGGPTPTWWGVIVVIAVVVAIAVMTNSSPAIGRDYSGTVVHVEDGDTFTIGARSTEHRIRLCGVDSPERGEKGYGTARDALAGMIAGRQVRCIQVRRKAGTPCDGRSRPTNQKRIVAQCFLDGGDIALRMVCSGHAKDWPKFSGGYYRAERCR